MVKKVKGSAMKIRFDESAKRNEFKNILIIKTIQKLYEEGHLKDESTYKEKRDLANKLEWTIGKLHKGIEEYLKLKKKEKDIVNKINEEAKKIEEENKEKSNG